MTQIHLHDAAKYKLSWSKWLYEDLWITNVMNLKWPHLCAIYDNPENVNQEAILMIYSWIQSPCEFYVVSKSVHNLMEKVNGNPSHKLTNLYKWV